VSRRVDNHFALRLIPPRPTFHLDADEDERAIMDRHATYWAGLADSGQVVVYGPVVDSTGGWGLGIFEAQDEAHARAIVDADPAVSSTLLRPELGCMLVAIIPD